MKNLVLYMKINEQVPDSAQQSYADQLEVRMIDVLEGRALLEIRPSHATNADGSRKLAVELKFFYDADEVEVMHVYCVGLGEDEDAGMARVRFVADKPQSA